MEREEEREWGEKEGVGRRGGNGNFYNSINFEKKFSYNTHTEKPCVIIYRKRQDIFLQIHNPFMIKTLSKYEKESIYLKQNAIRKKLIGTILSEKL